MTYAEVVYMILDELKLSSDDSYFNEYHVLMLVDKYRAMILKQRYKDIKKTVPYSNYQEVIFNLKKRTDFPDLQKAVNVEHNYDYISGAPLETNYYYSSDGTTEILNYVDKDGNGEKILKRGFPMLISIGNPSVYLDDYNRTMINLVSREHGRYVGNNKYLRNVLYAFIEPNKGLYVKIPDGFKMKLNPANREPENLGEWEGTINNPGHLSSNPTLVDGEYHSTETNLEVKKFYTYTSLSEKYTYTALFKCVGKVTHMEEETEVFDYFVLRLVNQLNKDLKKFDDDNLTEIPIKMVAVFEDSVYASEFTVEKTLHPLDRTFPMEDSLVNLVIEAVVKELTYPVYRKEDTENNGTDTMPENQAVAPNNRR